LAKIAENCNHNINPNWSLFWCKQWFNFEKRFWSIQLGICSPRETERATQVIKTYDSCPHTVSRVARWHILRPNIAIWVNFGGPCNGRC
jgi:hypothetical protein